MSRSTWSCSWPRLPTPSAWPGRRAAAARTSREAAEALYRGDFIEEDPDDDWTVGLREEVQATYISLARTLAEWTATSGDADGATRFYLRILKRDSFDEGAHLGLVSARRPAAVTARLARRYGFYATKMEEIGVEAAPFPVTVTTAARSGVTPGFASAG